MPRHFLLLLALLAAPLLPRAGAAEPPTITVSKSDSLAISLSPISGAEGPAITKTLQSDLALSGLFTLTEPSKSGILISGAANGSSLQGKAVDQAGRNGRNCKPSW